MNDLTTVLTTARAMIVTNGWVRYVYEGGCGVCAVGAIRRAGADYDMETTAVRALFKCLPEANKIGLGPFSAVFEWNDHVARSADDVLALFDRAIGVSKLERCPCCKALTLDRSDCGVSALYGARHLICVSCWETEDAAIADVGTNDLPGVLAAYGPPND